MKRAIAFLVLLVVIAAFWFAVSRYLTLEDAKRIARQMSSRAEREPLIVFLALALAQGVGMALALPTKAIFTLLAGALLGAIGGALASMTGVVAGTTALFFGARYLFRRRVRERLGNRLEIIEERLGRHPIRALIGLRLLITLPYGPITLAAALTSMRYRHFLIGSVLGDIPVNVAYCYAGRQLYLLTSVSDAVSPWTVATLAAVGLFIFITAIMGRNRGHFARRDP